MGWLEFIEDHQIDYQPGTEGNIEVHCPMCGSDDHGKHLGLSLESPVYGCWRNEDHSGGNPTRVIKDLLNCGWPEAKLLSKQYFNWHHDHEVLKRPDIEPIEEIPEEFLEFGAIPALEKQFLKYLEKRGYDPKHVINRYGLRWCIDGPFAYRLIIPIIHNKRWYTWIGRDITGQDDLKYKAATAKKDNVTAVPADFLFDGDNLSKGDLLLLVEGTFDAMKVQSAFIPGVSVVALCGQNISAKQIKALSVVAPNYKQVLVALDKDAYKHTLSIKQKLSWYLPKVGTLVPSGKDWGDMSLSKIREEIRLAKGS